MIVSQVVCEEDELKSKRAASLEQEHRIVRDRLIKKWQNPSAPGMSFVAKAVGVATLPIVGIWMLLLAGVSLAFGLIGFVLRLLGGPRKNPS